MPYSAKFDFKNQGSENKFHSNHDFNLSNRFYFMECIDRFNDIFK